MTGEEIDRIKATQKQRRYDLTTAGKAQRERDKERIKRGYRHLRDQGVPCREALRGARKAFRALLAAELANTKETDT